MPEFKSNGRVHPAALGLAFILTGILLGNSWWWGIGAIIVVAVFVDACFRYQIRD